MKVAFVLSRCSNLGPFIVARDIVHNIRDKVEAVDVYYIREASDKLHFKTGCTKIGFRERIDFSKYDVVHSHGFVADAYVFFHQGRSACRHVTTIHQRIAPDYAMKFNGLVGYSFEKLWCSLIRPRTQVVTLTREMIRYYSRTFRKNRMTYIYNGIDVPGAQSPVPAEEEARILALKEKYRIIGITARLIYLKGIDQVIRSLALNTDFALVVVGDGEKREELEQLARELNVGDRCLFLGYKQEALRYLKYFDVYAMVSRSEGFGLGVMEAASQKVPLVCSDLPVYRELFDKDDVVRFELENIPSLAAAFQQAVAQGPVLSERVYRKYKTEFTAGIMADNYLNLYRKLKQA